MHIINKNHKIIHLIKEINKSNKHPTLIVSDDLEVLKIANKWEYEIPYLLNCYEFEYKTETKHLLTNLQKQAKESYTISSSTYDLIKTKENHAGIIAVIKLKEYDFNALGDFIVVLDHLEIPGNIGTIYRTLDACKATGVILVDPISKPNNSKLLAASRGTNLIIPTISTTYDDALSYLLANNYDIYLGEPELGFNYQEYNYQGKIALVVGNERFGINPQWYNNPHKKVFIPMNGFNNSLNVGVAASILAYEAAMKRNNFK